LVAEDEQQLGITENTRPTGQFRFGQETGGLNSSHHVEPLPTLHLS
jgi:hypothetical protein